MSRSEQLIRQMQQEAPPRQGSLTEPLRARLAELTAELLAAHADSSQELDYYLAIRDRSIPLEVKEVMAGVAGATVVVTGGSGCVGTALLSQLCALGPARLISIANTPPAQPVPGVEYVHLDVRGYDEVE